MIKNLILILFLIVISSCKHGVIIDSAAFSAIESNYKSLQVIGCGMDRPASFAVCRGRNGQPVTDEINILLPPLETRVEVICGNFSATYTAENLLTIKLADIYGPLWDMDTTCLLAIHAKTTHKRGIAHYAADVMVYGYDERFIENPSNEDMAWKCDLRYSTQGRVKNKCRKI